MSTALAISYATKRAEITQNSRDLMTLHAESVEANEALEKFGRALSRQLGGEFTLGKNKDVRTAFDKAAERFGGDCSRLTDYARGSSTVDSVEQIEKAERLLEDSLFLQGWAARGFKVRECRNLFANPTSAGYRVLNIKVEVPLSGGRTHICELQIKHRGMENAYRVSHTIYEEQRRIARDFNSIAHDNVLSGRYLALEAQRRNLHDHAAVQCGLTKLERRQPARDDRMVA